MSGHDYVKFANRWSWAGSRRLCFLRLLAGMLFLMGAPVCHAAWTQDIRCPEGTVYRDSRTDAGGEEYCERLLPGSLAVKDGPYRLWFHVKFLGVEGSYANGRRVGPWKECNRFAECKHKDYPLAGPEEQARAGFKAEMPVSYRNGKYVFDFASCWSTGVTQSAEEDLNLNINGWGLRCVVSIAERAFEDGASASYVCAVPFSVGRRTVDSLDLRKEFPKLGLPQFCRPESTSADVLTIVNKTLVVVAGSTDVQCAAMEHGTVETLAFRLNPYASELVNAEAGKDGPLSTHLCFGPRRPNQEQPTVMVHEPGGGTLFRYNFDSDPSRARQQEDCVSTSFDLKTSCQ
jgi:hypothetical protein